MDRWNRFVDENRDLGLEAVRIFLGLALFAKGVFFAGHLGLVMTMVNDDFNKVLLAHGVAMAHLAGGLLLAMGLLTRLSAAVQLPMVLGAIFTVHWREGLFGPNNSLELAILVAALLVLFIVVGGGRWSTDYRMARRQARLEGRPVPTHVADHLVTWRRVS